MRNFVITLLLAIVAGGAWAQDSATVTDNCANHLNTSPNPTVGAMLNCLAEMQRTIDRLEAAASTPTALLQSDIAAIAQELVDNHTEAIKGEPGNSEETPPGLVAAFYRSERGALGACPAGWSLFSEAGGRFIVGAGGHTNVDENGGRLTRHPSAFDLPADAVGGSETHKLTVQEMPKHRHLPHGEVDRIVGYDNEGPGDRAIQTRSTDGASLLNSAVTSFEGGDQPHNNMPPYIALYFCKKE